MTFFIISVLAGILYANFLEWGLHKFVLHDLGKNKKSIWSSHFHVHHQNSVRFEGGDPDYLTFKWSSEKKGLLGLIVLHSPVLLLSVPAFVTLTAYGCAYYYAHRRSHLDPVWGWKYIPWHMDHHLGAPSKNWCVLFPLADYILGTRKISRRNPNYKSA